MFTAAESRIDVPVRGGTLAAFRLGASDPAAPLVVVAHGITSNSHSFVRVARELGGRGQLVAVDLRGRGASRALPSPFGIAAHAADLHAVLEHLGADDAVLGGHSMGAWVVARLAADHPERVRAAVLVDGGLALPGAEAVDPQAFLDAFLGPSVERLGMRFASPAAYRAFWRRHPALSGPEVEDADLAAFADHDLVGQEPELRSWVVEEAVRADGAELLEAGSAVTELKPPAALLRAERGLRDEPEPMVPPEAAAAWAGQDPERRELVEVPGVNHYTITMGTGARAVAQAIGERLA